MKNPLFAAATFLAFFFFQTALFAQKAAENGAISINLTELPMRKATLWLEVLNAEKSVSNTLGFQFWDTKKTGWNFYTGLLPNRKMPTDNKLETGGLRITAGRRWYFKDASGWYSEVQLQAGRHSVSALRPMSFSDRDLELKNGDYAFFGTGVKSGAKIKRGPFFMNPNASFWGGKMVALNSESKDFSRSTWGFFPLGFNLGLEVGYAF